MESVSLPRRTGFFVRWRARSGLLPGQVSTAALVDARRLRWASFVSVPVLLFFAALIIGAALASTSTTDEAAIVVQAFGPDELTEDAYPYRIVLDDGTVVDLDDDPQLAEGDDVVVRVDGDGDPVGLVVDGELLADQPYYDDDPWLFVVLGSMFAAFLVFAGPTVVWSWRTHRQVRADLGGPVETVAGRYWGSWQWRGLTNRLGRVGLAGTVAHHLAGVPVAIETDGHVVWFAAPATRVPDLVHFESVIKDGDRRVTVLFHPHTRAIARLEGDSGATVLDFRRALDELDPAAGLSLKVSRRKRTAHLPDF